MLKLWRAWRIRRAQKTIETRVESVLISMRDAALRISQDHTLSPEEIKCEISIYKKRVDFLRGALPACSDNFHGEAIVRFTRIAKIISGS